MNRYDEIKEEVNRGYEVLREKEKSKPKNQLILESLNPTIVNAERQLFRWKELNKTITKNISFSQLCGTFLFEYAVLLKERTILDINHILEENKDSINIVFFLNIIENGRQRFIKNYMWEEAQDKIRNHRLEIDKLRSEYVNVIIERDKKIAHKDKEELGNEFNMISKVISIEQIDELLNKLISIVDYYYELFEINDRLTLDKILVVEESIGFKTGINHLVSVVNLAFENLNFENTEIQKIAEDFKYFK